MARAAVGVSIGGPQHRDSERPGTNVCGLAGKVDFGGRIDPTLIHRMCSAIEHRGPDSRGVWCEDGVGLGLQRLAIIDVAGGDQPIFNEDHTVGVVVECKGTAANDELLRDVAAHIAALNPPYATVADVPADVLDKEKAL